MTSRDVAESPFESPYRARGSLAGRTILMSGGSRGIGLAIARRAARDGANIVLLAKTGDPHPKLEGTVHTAATQLREAGGQALALVGDVRSDADVAAAVASAVERFGGIDVVINNASAIDLSRTDALDMKRYDLMQDINVRGAFLLSKLSLPALRKAQGAHILTLSPPLNLDPKWAGRHLAYTLAKYGMSLTTLGLAEELRQDGIAVNSLWPRTLIDTAAIRNLPDGENMVKASRSPEIMADAAHAILTGSNVATANSGTDDGGADDVGTDDGGAETAGAANTGNFYIDEQVLRAAGVSDFSSYGRGMPEDRLVPDIFL